MVTALPYECMLVNSQRPGLEYCEYGRLYFAHSVDVYGYTAMGALYTRRMSPRSGMVSNAGGLERCGTLTLAPIVQVHCITMYQD
jgi:hypothetical protein